MNNCRKIVFASSLTLYFIALLCFSYVSLHTLMMADDYCYFAILNRGSFFSSQIDSYTSAVVIAGNRFSASLVSGLISEMGSWAIQLFPTFTYIWLFLSFFLLTRQVFRYLEQESHWLIAGVFSAAFLFFLLYLSPARFQNRYWFSGIVAYTIPLAVFCTLVGLIILSLCIPKRKYWLSIAIFVLSFLCAGFSETSASAFLTCIILLFFCLFLFKKKLAKWDIIFACAGMLIGTGLLILSPSSQARVGNLELSGIKQISDPLTLLGHSVRFSFDFIWYSVSGLILPLSVCSIFFASLGNLHYKNENKPIILGRFLLTGVSSSVATVIVIAASMAPTLYAFSAYPNPRSQLICMFFLLAGIAIFSYQVGGFLGKFHTRFQYAALAILILSGIYALRGGFLELPTRDELQQRRDIWVERDMEIRSLVNKGETSASIHGINRIETISDYNPACFQEYYGIQEIQLLD